MSGSPKKPIIVLRRCGGTTWKSMVMPSGRHHPAAQALDDAERDQAGVVPGQAAQQRAAGEQGHRDQVQALGAEGVREVARRGHDDRQRQHVTGHHQLGLVDADAEDGGDLGQRDIDHGLVEHDHERADDRAGQHLPLVVEAVKQASNPKRGSAGAAEMGGLAAAIGLSRPRGS